MASFSPMAAIEGGFEDPVIEAQSVFRALMDAMAHPATVYPVASTVAPPGPLSAVAASVICALADPDTPVWLGSALAASGPVAEWLAFQTGAPLVASPAQAEFALVADASAMPSLDGFAQGTQEYPDRSTTLVIQVASLTGGPRLTFAGPGILDRQTIAPVSMPQHFAAQWRANGARFPRGVDLILAGPMDDSWALACLPRSARLVEVED